MAPAPGSGIELEVDGRVVEVADAGVTLLDLLRDALGARSVKDGCSPQGQCGCCTVLVDGVPRVACVTPVRRVAGRRVTTLDGLDPDVRQRWARAFVDCGASQCGFCTPGIVLRLEALRRSHADEPGQGLDRRAVVDRALAAHLCRCTGWQTIVEAAGTFGETGSSTTRTAGAATRDLDRATRRATIEGGTSQRVAPVVPLGEGGFAADQAPAGALVAVADGEGGWSIGESLAEARARAGKVQGRRTTLEARPPLALPEGDWVRTLRTSWVEPAYLETDASWCEPGGEPASPLANGGAFGGKRATEVGAVARRLADEHGRAVLVLSSREDTVRFGPKRPPIAAGVRSDGTGVVHVVRTPGIADAMAVVAPRLEVVEVDAPGPPTSVDLRAAGWAEAAVLLASLTDEPGVVRAPGGAYARAAVVAADGDVGLDLEVSCGDPLDEVVLRSYCIGAAHMALGWVTSEGVAVADDGEVLDLTIRSFGIVRPADMPHVSVHIQPSGDEPVPGSDAVFAAVAGAVWAHQGFPPTWPTGLALRV